MKKCLKCKTKIKKSPLSSFTGYESYRCPKCDSLFSPEDFRKNSKKDLIRPEFKYKEYDSCFSYLKKNNYVNMAPDRGVSLFVARILESNWDAIGVVPSSTDKDLFLSRSDKEISVEVLGSFLHNINYYYKEYNYFFIEELLPIQEKKLKDAIKTLKLDKNRFFFIERSL